MWRERERECSFIAAPKLLAECSFISTIADRELLWMILR